jgi:hypothetical protein
MKKNEIKIEERTKDTTPTTTHNTITIMSEPFINSRNIIYRLAREFFWMKPTYCYVEFDEEECLFPVIVNMHTCYSLYEYEHNLLETGQRFRLEDMGNEYFDMEIEVPNIIRYLLEHPEERVMFPKLVTYLTSMYSVVYESDVQDWPEIDDTFKKLLQKLII